MLQLQRTYWGPFLFLLMATQLAASACAHGGNEGERQKNVIIVMTDEHNFRTLGCYRQTMEQRQAYMWGPAVVETPHIDWIARQGAICTSYYATTPVCSPSRAAFVSGLYPQATPVVTNNIPMADSVVTFAEILGRQGYVTGYAGKWHLDGDGKPQWAPKRKFGFQDNRYMFNRGHWKKFEMTDNGPRVAARNQKGVASYAVDGADQTSFSTDWLMDRALEFIDQHQSKPFCYMLSLPDPHGPDTVRAPYDTMFQDQTYEKPTTFDLDERTIPKWGEPANKTGFGQSKYYGMVKCIDDNIGRLIERLRSRNLLDNTIIVFTSDHGDLRGEHHRQNKGVAFEGSVRIPFLVYSKDQIAAGTRVDMALGSVDFVPTLMSLLSVKTDRTFHGRDASVLLTEPGSEKSKSWQDIAFVRSTNYDSGWLMAVSDRYKVIFASHEDPWVFDLQRDPDELINQRDNPAYRQIIQSMSKQLLAYAKKHQDPRLDAAKIRSDLEWAVGQQQYESAAKRAFRKNE